MNKTTRIILTLSIFLNIIFLGYGIKKILWKYEQYELNKQKNELRISKNENQPTKVQYFISRNEVFTKLPKDSGEIVMLGNSLTHNFEWHEAFKGVKIINRGINSDITKGIIQRLDEITNRKPKKVFIEIGINDLLKGFRLDSVFINYTEILSTLKRDSPNTKIYVQSLLPTNWKSYSTGALVIDSVNSLNNKLLDYCNHSNIQFIDLYSEFELNKSLNPKYDCGDKLHLSGEGYILWCKTIEKYIYE